MGRKKAYGNLGNAYQTLGDYRIAIEYHETHLKIAVEIGDRAREGRAYGNLGNAYLSLDGYRKAMEYHEKGLKFQKKSVIGPEKEEPMEVSVLLSSHWKTIEKRRSKSLSQHWKCILSYKTIRKRGE